MKKKSGDRCETSEGAGVVVEVCDAQKVYPAAPTYKRRSKGERKETKFPKGTEVYRVAIDSEQFDRDGQPRRAQVCRNFHESQITG